MLYHFAIHTTSLKFVFFWVPMIPGSKSMYNHEQEFEVHLGYFPLVGVIFTLWSKIYPSEDKMKWEAFSTKQGLHFLGNSDGMIHFWVKPQFPLKMKNEIAIFSNCEG